MKIDQYLMHFWMTKTRNLHILNRTTLLVGEEVTFELEHLASFGVTSKQGGGSVPADVGLDRLKQMVSTTGVWAMKVVLRIDHRQITVVDKTSLKVPHLKSQISFSYKQICIAP